MIYALGLLVFTVGMAAWAVFLAGKRTADKDTAEAKAQAYQGEAQKWADRPRDVFDAAARLRERAELKRREANLLDGS